MPLHSESKHYQIVTSPVKPWILRIEKFVAGELVCEVRHKVTEKVLYSITLTYDESYALREALWWIEHIEPEPSTY